MWLEPVKAKRFLCGCVGEHHVRIVEHVQAVQSERVDLEVVQRKLGVDVEADVCREGAGELLGQAGGRLAAHWRTTITIRNTLLTSKKVLHL